MVWLLSVGCSCPLCAWAWASSPCLPQTMSAAVQLPAGAQLQRTPPALPPACCTTLRSAAVAQLIEAAAHEVYQQCSNRHSMNEPWVPSDLLTFVQAYAKLRVHDGGWAQGAPSPPCPLLDPPPAL